MSLYQAAPIDLEPVDIDPVEYEIFQHRLFNILEEGRIAIKMVSGSPVVVEGGETMCAIYDRDGTPILVAAGILLHCMGAWDFIKKTIEWYSEEPGIHEGDQFFYNDPYIGGQHLADYVIVKPIFHRGELIAWCASIMHTPETGGLEPGGQHASSTELYHEGFKALGLKIVDRGQFRPEIFRTITEQTRDPHLVGLDTKAKIAANNVCARHYLELVERYGLDFVKQASRKMIHDSALMAEDKLRRLPDGTWRSRHYGDMHGLKEGAIKVCCTMTKEGDRITFDYTGSSPQVEGSINSTLPATWGSLFVVLASQLFWDVPWNGGMFAPVELVAPQGTIVHCNYPAACSTDVFTVGCMITQTAHECIAKMLYAAGLYEDVNSGWMSGHGTTFFGGVNQHGGPVVGTILDTFAAGTGATPNRDGVHTGANMMNPQSNISDVEVLEMNLPILFLLRRQSTDSGGFGKFVGGAGGESVYMVHKTERFALGLVGIGRKTPASKGMFGGYPGGLLQQRYCLNNDLENWFAQSKTINGPEDLHLLGGQLIHANHTWPAVPMKEYDFLYYLWSAGGGYGDPLERDPERVLQDVENGIYSVEMAAKAFGVVITEDGRQVDRLATEQLRESIRQERLQQSVPVRGGREVHYRAIGEGWRIHEYLQVLHDPEEIQCCKCGCILGALGENYKERALLRTTGLEGWVHRTLPQGVAPMIVYQEYICPGCGTLLEVDLYCPELDEEEPIVFDLQLTKIPERS